MKMLDITLPITLILGTIVWLSVTHAQTTDKRIVLGAALSHDIIDGKDSLGIELARRHFQHFTAENALKLNAIQPEEGKFQFDRADRFIDFASQNRATITGHTLIWHEAVPDWLFKDGDKKADRNLMLARMKTHISTLVGRYKGKIKFWDVVNEAISDDPNVYLRPTPWLEAIGEDYIEHAFRFAHEADPHAQLIYNDYNTPDPHKREKIIKLLASLKSKGVPVHGLGMQGHWKLEKPKIAEIQKTIQAVRELGLIVLVTELDLSVLPWKQMGADVSQTQMMEEGLDPYVNGCPEDVLLKQAKRAEELFQIFLQNRDVINHVTFWGVYDKNSWLNNFPIKGRTDHPLLFDRMGQPKPIFHAISRLLKQPSIK